MFIESLAPSFVKSDGNPNGVDQAAVDTVRQAILDDRPAWLARTTSRSTADPMSCASPTPKEVNHELLAFLSQTAG